jgi:hypothetical protein
MTVFLPLFYGIMTALNVYLVISNYRQDSHLDAALHTLYALNFAIMFLVESEEYVHGRKSDKVE